MMNRNFSFVCQIVVGRRLPPPPLELPRHTPVLLLHAGCWPCPVPHVCLRTEQGTNSHVPPSCLSRRIGCRLPCHVLSNGGVACACPVRHVMFSFIFMQRHTMPRNASIIWSSSHWSRAHCHRRLRRRRGTGDTLVYKACRCRQSRRESKVQCVPVCRYSGGQGSRRCL